MANPGSAMSRVRMAEIPWTTYRDRVAKGAVVIVPCGATEQHGPHLPLGVDHLLSAATAADVASELLSRGTDCLVAPALAYGYKSQAKMGGGQRFPGTTSLDAHTLALQLCDVLRELFRHGVRNAVVLNGHYENQIITMEGIDLARREHPELTVMRLEYWDFTPEATLQRIFPAGFPGYALEHAAVLETSLMLHHHPELVDLSAIPSDLPAEFPPYDMHPQTATCVPPSGVLSSARDAKVEYGTLLAADYATLIADAIADVFA
jgi:creatinine amidohydrolase